jgi:hypothetical protein
MIYEYEHPWWNDVDREKLLIRPPELSGNPTRRLIWQQAGKRAKGMMNLAL